jgi:diguanylate cyclase (GGDEF)-like protein
VPRKRLAATSLAPLSAAFETLDQGYMLLDDNDCVAGFNNQLLNILRLPDGMIRVGVSARDLIQASAMLGDYPGLNFADVAGKWMARLGVRAAGSHVVDRPGGGTFKIGYSPFGRNGWIIAFEDISARIEAEAALAVQSRRFEAALINMPHGVCMFDAAMRLILCNASYASLYDLPVELTAAGTPLQQILDYRAAHGSGPSNMKTYFRVADEAEAAGETRSGQVDLQDGRTIRVAYNPMAGGGYVATHEDITASIRAEEQIRYMASYDLLTGLPNRSHLLARMAETVRRAQRGEMFAIHHLDIDDFKSVNEAHGHVIGDRLLKCVAERLRGRLRDGDILARVGADEFVVVQINIERAKQAETLAQRLLDGISEPFAFDGNRLDPGASIGVAICPTDGVEVETLLKNADLGLSRAKSEGRKTYHFFERSMDARLQSRRRLEADLRHALSFGEFELYYQPQVDAQTEAITGCEALLRWRHPSRGIVPPGDFIAAAEEIGLINPLGAWVIQEACREGAGWPDDISVAVNLSSAQFKDAGLYQTVVDALEKAGLPARRLELEITESALLTNSGGTIDALTKLRALGVRIAMDDFGTGYSSLSYLRLFPFDKIKIDRSFIEDIDKKDDCSAIVRAMASLGSELGMVITAEGVETVEQLRLVREHGCNEVQGYFFGRPCPSARIREVLRAAREGGPGGRFASRVDEVAASSPH